MIELINSVGFVAIDLGSLATVEQCMRSALHYPSPTSTAFSGFIEPHRPVRWDGYA